VCEDGVGWHGGWLVIIFDVRQYTREFVLIGVLNVVGLEGWEVRDLVCTSIWMR
jgi:hypothetical protein